jgi:predicted transcriptional regulator
MKRKTSVSLDEKIHRRLSSVAKRERRSISNLLEFFIERSISGQRVGVLADGNSAKNGATR